MEMVMKIGMNMKMVIGMDANMDTETWARKLKHGVY
jgi:hypothetical protein